MSTAKMEDDLKPLGRSLASLQFFLFFFFAGIGALVPFLPLHMRAAGLTAREARVVSTAAPLIGLLGPLVAAVLLGRGRGRGKPPHAHSNQVGDVEASGSAERTGKKLRFLLAFTVLGAALCYSVLLLLPTVTWFPARRPSVSFSCNGEGAAVLQERCMEPACYHWPEHEVGPLILTNCEYDCPSASKVGVGRYRARVAGAAGATGGAGGAGGAEGASTRAPAMRDGSRTPGDPPHICVSEAGRPRTCHVFTGSGAGISVNASLRQATNPEADHDQWCDYPVAEMFSCALPASVAAASNASCRVLCDIEHPYTAEGSVLAQSQCQVLVGDPALTFWSYLAVRCVADAFPNAALVMVDTALVVATREVPAALGVAARKPDLGRQVAVGLLGTALAAPLAGLFSPYPAAGPSPAGWPAYGVPILAFVGCMVVAAAVLLCSSSMPVGAPDWWWQLNGSKLSKSARTSMMNASCESAALFLVLALLGAFCSAIDSYLPWHVSGLRRLTGSDGDLAGWGATPELLLGLNVLAGVLPAVPFLWRSEAFVQYCGYSNLLITAFTFYIIRYAGLTFVWSPWWILVLEATEMFTLSIMWVTAVLYFTHLMPRAMTSTGQAMAVAAHFCIGRSLGALLGGLLARDALPPDDEQDTAPPDDPELQQLRPLYATGAGAAAMVAIAYFVVYHCCLRPRWDSDRDKDFRKAGVGGRGGDRSVLAGHNMNGSYTPLRVYHNGRNTSSH